MIYRTFGQTGIRVSAIGFGGMRFEDQKDVDKCASLVKASYNAGINYFDTAIGYGDSEDIFGVALKEMKKTRAGKPFYIATKTSKSEPKDIRKDLETSLKRMGLDYIDFYHVWCVLTLADFANRRTKGALTEFERLKEEGLINHICVSIHLTGDEIDKMLNDYPFEGILLGYSAMNFKYRDAGLDAAATLNRGVVVMNPLGGGIIPQHPERFSFVKTRQDETVVEGALRFLINDPRITVVLVGLSNEKQLREAVSAVDGFQPIPSQAIRTIRDGLQSSYNEMCTGCQYCDNCPEGIPVPKMMDAYNQYMLSHNAKNMLDRLYWHWGISADNEYITKCSECGNCEEECTQKLPIINRLRYIRDEAEKYLVKKANKV